MSKVLNFNNVRIYHIDLTVTDDCNFNCGYCFEHGHFNKNYFQDIDLFLTQINSLLESFFFKNNYHMIGIGFWGGEPTLNEKVIREIINYYKNNDKVKFFIYSNGSMIDDYMDILIEFSQKRLTGGHPKLCIQMSYDGNPVHDIYRRSKDNKLTSTLVRNNIRTLYKQKIPSVVKSTITPETLKYLSYARADILDLHKEFNFPDLFKSSNYFPTIDYYNLNSYGDEEIEQYKKELEEELIKVAKEEIEYFKQNGVFFFSWFSENRALCSAGKDMVCINWDGNIFKCHGSLYENECGDHFICNLNDSELIRKLIKSHELHSTNFGYQPKKCKDCFVSFCLRCNPVKYNLSEKENYIDKWRDYTVQPRLCSFYEINGKIVLALRQLLK